MADYAPDEERDKQRNKTRAYALLFVGGYLLLGQHAPALQASAFSTLRT
jgi:hypothetical protein